MMRIERIEQPYHEGELLVQKRSGDLRLDVHVPGTDCVASHDYRYVR